MATITQVTKEDTFTEVTFRSDSEKEYKMFVDKIKGTVIVETYYIHYLNYGHEKQGNAYKVFSGTIEEVKKVSMERFLSQFK